jgi:molybdopterin-containing oxidoreductase family membrane subunit
MGRSRPYFTSAEIPGLSRVPDSVISAPNEENKIMETTTVQPIIKPIEERKLGFYVLVTLLAGATSYWLYYCARLLSEGHLLLGTDSYGATWGITVANIVHIIGISHVGIAISATVRILELEKYRKIARLAELITLIALLTAVVNIGLDVGRPDRFISETLIHGKWYTPMVWSMTVIVLYFMASFVYLYLSMRRDFLWLSGTNVKFNGLYRFLALGYTGTRAERERHEHTLFWLAIALVPIMISVHSVYGLFFGLIPAKPGWFNPLQAPYFVLGAIVSGFSAIIVIAALLRRAYEWQTLLTNEMFKVFGTFLACTVFLYLYFLASEQLTAQFAGLPAEKAASDSILFGSFSGPFRATVIFGLMIPFTYLFIQGVRKGYVNVDLTAAAALLINAAMWTKRFLIVVPAQYQAQLPLPRPAVPYSPSYPEYVITLGSYAFAALIFLALLKILPVIELQADTHSVSDDDSDRNSTSRTLTMAMTLLVGIAMIAWGYHTRDLDFAPIKWLIGLVFLTAIPLERCLIRDTRSTQRERDGTIPD